MNSYTQTARLWFDNGGEDLYTEITEAVREARKQEEPLVYLSRWMKSLVAEGKPDLGSGFYADLLSVAIEDIDFRLIAEEWLSEDI